MALIRFAASSAPEVRAAVGAGAIALWPIGATEQHGSHLATGFDLASATAVCERAAEKSASPIVVLPGLPVGASQHWLTLGATLSLRPATLLAVLSDIIHSVERCGFGHLVIVNGHFGNVGPMTAALGNSEDFSLTVEVVSYWMLVNRDQLIATCLADHGDIGHAGEVETSIGMVLDLVAHSGTPPSPGRPLKGDGPGAPAAAILRLPRPLDESPEGVYGDPTCARRELGEFVLTDASDALARHLDRALTVEGDSPR